MRKNDLLAALAAIILGALTALSGCAMKPGTVTTSFAPGSKPPPPKQVTQAGTYYLRPAGPGPSELVTFYDLAAGDSHGFRQRPDGKAVAFVVTDDQEVEIELPDRPGTRYEWEFHTPAK